MSHEGLVRQSLNSIVVVQIAYHHLCLIVHDAVVQQIDSLSALIFTTGSIRIGQLQSCCLAYSKSINILVTLYY